MHWINEYFLKLYNDNLYGLLCAYYLLPMLGILPKCVLETIFFLVKFLNDCAYLSYFRMQMLAISHLHSHIAYRKCFCIKQYYTATLPMHALYTWHYPCLTTTCHHNNGIRPQHMYIVQIKLMITVPCRSSIKTGTSIQRLKFCL